jgi:AcrR family transcriptional regulator
LVATKKNQIRKKKADWLEAALDVFEKEGIEGVRVERLARDLNVAKSGFYWHFKDRDDLHEQMLRYWEDEFTGVVTLNVELVGLPPADRLLRATRMIWEHDLGKYDLSFRAWAQGQPEILARVNRIYDKRLSFARTIFRELGFTGAELEMRTYLWVGYHSWERITFPEWSKEKAKRFIKWRVAFFIRP